MHEQAAEVPDESQTGRLEAFSDGVLAVIITIMALELRAPAAGGFKDLARELPELLVYMLSFTFIGIYWNNHHQMLKVARRTSGSVMWANLHLLFWLSLIPVLTEWVGTGSHWRDTAPAAAYATVAMLCGVAYTLLQQAIIRTDGPSSALAEAVGRDIKGRISIVAYASAFGLAWLTPLLSYGLFVAVAIMWWVPDRRIERRPARGPMPAADSDLTDG